MRRIIRELLGRSYSPLNKIQISRAQLLDNYHFLASVNNGVKITPVLKSNAYGHGLVLIAKILDNVGAPFFCVDSLYEAYELLKVKIKTPILVLGYIEPSSLNVKKLSFSFAVYDLNLVSAIEKYQKDASIHLFVDTGMNREGVKVKDLPNFLKGLKKFSRIRLEGLMSHLAKADSPSDKLIKEQIENFNEAKLICCKFGFTPQWTHLAASSGLLSFKNLSSISNVSRTGLALYGIDPSRSNPKLRPVLKLTSKIIQIKKIEKGEKVGYDATFTSPEVMLIGLLPVGYFEGIDRRLSNKGIIYVGNVKCPIIGRVSMNLTVIDITGVENPIVGQEVEIYSDDPQRENSFVRASILCQTIPYDLLVHLNSSIKREVV